MHNKILFETAIAKARESIAAMERAMDSQQIETVEQKANDAAGYLSDAAGYANKHMTAQTNGN